MPPTKALAIPTTPTPGLPHGPSRPAIPPEDLGHILLVLPRGPGRELRVTWVEWPGDRAGGRPRDRPGGQVGDRPCERRSNEDINSEDASTSPHPRHAVRFREWAIPEGGDAMWPRPGRSCWVAVEDLPEVVAALEGVMRVVGGEGGERGG